ncbi:MAG: hypothetical protein II263_06955 [Lachnospiraceae bacterium]|nr:hypothetical protein [Lachnospiraceae bacterium]
MGLNVILPLLGGLAVVAVLAAVILMKNRTAYLGPVREELQKEKAWLRRGEYNAAMVRGRQNLELLLKLVAEKNGIRLDNSAKAQEEAERQNQNRGKKTPQVMTHHQFNRWLSENGYIDRVARWELNQVRVIGNKAVHENYADKDDAWNQFNYLEDVLKTITERSQNPKKRQEQAKQQVEKPKQTESEPQDQTPKKKKRRKKKSAQPKQNAPEIKETAAVEVQKPKQVKKAQPEKVQQEAPQEEQAVEKKKPRRRRRRKKSQNPQNPQVQTEAVKPAKSESKKPEPKKSEPKKEPEVINEGEQKANPHKRRRRRRPRKPQTAQEQNSSGE